MRTAHWVGALAAFASSTPAMSAPSDYIITPIVEEGEREIDFKSGSAKLRNGNRESQTSVGLGLGVNGWWSTELYAIWHKPPGQRNSFDAWEWENKFQLTDTGKYPVDLGLLFEIERPKDRAEGYEYRWGPLVQADLTSDVQANLNVLFEKHIRANAPGKAELGYQWQLKYRWRPAFEFGLQGFGDVGPWNQWEPHSQQPHVVGPVAIGRLSLGGRQAIKYNAGLLFGLTDGAPRRTIRVQAEFEF